MTKRLAVLAVAAVALAAQPALEAGTRGGGHGGGRSSGGGRPSGGGHAVPRGSGPAYRPGGSAQARHPQAGAYYGGSHSGRYYGGYSGGYSGGSRYYSGRRYYGYGYRPGYGYYSPRYYGRSFGLYFGFGDPYFHGSVGWGWPGYGAYGWSPYLYPPSSNVYVYSSPEGSSSDRYAEDAARDDRRSDDVRRDTSVPNTGRVRIEVRPEDASVYVDDEFWGPASESRRIVLRAGRHRVELVRPGFEVARRDVDVVPGETSDVLVELQRR